MDRPTLSARQVFSLARQSVMAFIDDDMLSKGASISFYTVTSMAPILLIVIAIAGLAFGNEAAQGAVTAQLSGLMGSQSAEILQTAVHSASDQFSGVLNTVLGLITLLVTASGVFGEMQSSLNIIWKTQPSGATVTRLVKARAASLGLVAALGFLLLVSLVISALLSAFGGYANAALPMGQLILSILSFVISYLLIAMMFAAIYKVLPDTRIEWRDVITGALITALLFVVGKTLIGMYLGSTAIASSYGAAGGLIILLLWIYYSAQTFLLGAEFTRAFALRHGSKNYNNVVENDLTRGSLAPANTVSLGGLVVAAGGILLALKLQRVWLRARSRRR